MPTRDIVDLRTIDVPGVGPMAVLWEQPVHGWKLLALLPAELAQPYLDAIQTGEPFDVVPQVVEERDGLLCPLPEEISTQYLKAWVDQILG